MEELLLKMVASLASDAPLVAIGLTLVVLGFRHYAKLMNDRVLEANARAEQMYEDSKQREDRIIEAMDKNNEVNCQMLATLQRHSDMISGVILEQTQMRDKYDRMSNDITEIKTMLKH